MSITLSSAIADLLKGVPLTWDASGSFKGGTIQLDKASQRRLFNFLVEQSMDEVIVASETLFDGLTEAWEDEKSDPASNEAEIQKTAINGPWRLTRIEAKGFGGLNTPDGPPFELDVGGENWCLEGYNGSGKTSLASLILWTLTGYRNREQDGPFKDTGIREIVTNGSKKIGTWPPLVTYPSKPEDLKKSAFVSATLTFIDPTGEQATATREVESPVEGDPSLVETVDPRLLASPELIETGLLMPARIGHIGFGSKSQSLHQALKMLTGLDKLAAIGTGAAAFGHGAKRFLKYAKDNGINGFEQTFSDCLEQAREHAENTSIDFTKQYRLGAEKLIEELSIIDEDASTKAGAALSLLKTEIADEIDVDDGNDRDRLNKAVNKARVYLDEGSKGIPLFAKWGSLTQAGKEGFSDVSGDLDAANAALSKALEWHTKQESDQKLRLKALASTFCVREDLLSGNANCPLCETKLTSDAQLILATELADLKAESEHAERAISDACSDIEKTLNTLMPNSLSSHFESLATMEPAKAFSSAIKERFSSEPPFNDILTGIGTFVANYAVDKENTLPSFSHTPVTYDPSTIVSVRKLQTLMINIARVSALAAWWTHNRVEFLSAWKELIGEKNAENEWPINCLQGKIRTLEEAIEASGPLDKIATLIDKAKKAAASWASIQAVQKVREEIVEGLEPLKKLQQLVDCQTHHTVMTLRDRVEVILNNIRLKGPLSFKSTEITKKAVTVEGSFTEVTCAPSSRHVFVESLSLI